MGESAFFSELELLLGSRSTDSAANIVATVEALETLCKDHVRYFRALPRHGRTARAWEARAKILKQAGEALRNG